LGYAAEYHSPQADAGGNSQSERAIFQFTLNLQHGGVSLPRELSQAAADGALQVGGKFLDKFAKRFGLLSINGDHRVKLGLAMERFFPGEHFVENSAERKNISAGADC